MDRLPPDTTPARWPRLRPTVTYMLQTEAHVYALAIAASVLLSFYPFIIVMVSFCRGVLHWPDAVKAIFLAMADYFPGELAGFVQRNSQQTPAVPITSMILLLLTANGVFEPLEVALNRAWGVTKNRPYWRNQLIALGLIFVCGMLALASLLFTALSNQWMTDLARSNAGVQSWLNQMVFKLAAIPLSILALFLVYWLLPNRKIEPARVAPAAILVGLILEGLKYLDLFVWGMLEAKIKHEYGPFQHSATILLWSFTGGLIVLAGAEWSARGAQSQPAEDPLYFSNRRLT